MTEQPVRSQPASLWIGERLSYLDLLCLKSFADIGQPVTLFTYEQVLNVPDYVHHADAREVFDTPEILRQKVGRKHLIGSPAIHADIFRIRLLETSDFFWVDTDAYALRPLMSVEGYLFSRVGGYVPNGVLSLPRDSLTLKHLVDFVSQSGAIPPWWSEAERQAFENSGQPLDFRYMKWGTLGPIALSHFLEQTGELSKAHKADILYPIRARHRRLFFDEAWIDFPRRVQSIHLYASGLRDILLREHDGVPPKGSFLAALCDKHEIDPMDAPLR